MNTKPSPSTLIDRAGELLTSVFGFEAFKPLQREIIANVLNKRDTLVVMPTGGGKSLCYQIPALIFDGLTIVVSPLISLMKDQVEQLRELGVPAAFLNSSLAQDEYLHTMERIRRREVKLLYVAPETLLTARLFNLLESIRVDCLAIDEAHCISEWGHDFRPEYRQLAEARRLFSHAVCVALTATATPRVRSDIQRSLRFDASNEFVASFNRENLLLEVTQKVDATGQVVEFIRRFPDQSGIIYCFSRKQVDELAARLDGLGFSVRPYHAGLTDEERQRNQELFIRDDVQIIVATIAFGMGINKPNVRFVVHHDLPKSIESYYQEIGRAGRDGLPAHCLLLFSYADIRKVRYFIDQKEGAELEAANLHLNALVRYAETDLCRRLPLLEHFGEKFESENCGWCDNCRNGGGRQVEATIPAQKFISCVKRSGERFGMNHVIDVLLGSQSQKVLRFGHDKLSTYGIGKELTREQWLRLARQLIQKGYLEQDEHYGSLRFTSKTAELLKREASFFAVLEDGAPAYLPERAQVKHDERLFARLRELRKSLADQAGVPPYVIFADKTLIEMATYYPASEASLEQIFGIGERKLRRYGAEFLAVIREYCQQHGIREVMKGSTHKAASARQSPKKQKYELVGEAYNQGASVEELAERFGIQPGTVMNYLVKYQLEGNALRLADDLLRMSALPPEQQQRVFAVFDQVGTEFLKPAFEALGGEVSYDELKVLRLYHLSRK